MGGEVPGPVWTNGENLAPAGIRSPDRPARNELLHRLNYPGPYKTLRIHDFMFHPLLDLPSGTFASDFPTRILFVILVSPIPPTCPAHLILIHLITLSFVYSISPTMEAWGGAVVKALRY